MLAETGMFFLGPTDEGNQVIGENH